MKRKTSTTPTKIWSFGARGPTTNADLFHEQLFLGNRYYNTLIEIERKRRDKFREARSEASPELARLENEYARLNAALEAGIAALPAPEGEAKKKKKKLTPELLELQAARKVTAASLKAERERFKVDPESKAAVAQSNDAANLATKEARAATDLYWGSYLLIEKQIEQARKSKSDPKFRRFSGGGRVGVQLQGGLTTAELQSGEDTRLKLLPRVSPTKNRTYKHEVHIRIGSDGRAPVWAVLPVVIHREIPPDAKIQWAWIKVEIVGGDRKYFLQLALESETFAAPRPAGKGVVAINFGWRAQEDGSRRVAYAVDDSGHEQEFVLPASIERRLSYTSNIRSIRDLNFEEAKRAVGGFMAINEVPEWLKEATQHLWQWRSPKKLARVSAMLTKELLTDYSDVKRWYAERLSATPKLDLFAPAAEIFKWLGRHDLRALAFYLELWRKKDRHLWRWEANPRGASERSRNEMFRVWSRRLADRYAEIRIEKFDMRRVAQAEPIGDEDKKPSTFRSTRAAAAPGEFRSRLKEAAGAKIVETDAHDNTVTCFECGHVNERPVTQVATCAGCGRSWDQDANNCRNQLRSLPRKPRKVDDSEVVAAE